MTRNSIYGNNEEKIFRYEDEVTLIENFKKIDVSYWEGKDYFFILFCTDGSASIHIGNANYAFSRNSILVCAQSALIKDFVAEKDFQSQCIVLSPKY